MSNQQYVEEDDPCKIEGLMLVLHLIEILWGFKQKYYTKMCYLPAWLDTRYLYKELETLT